jgi:hypothetical protein
MRAVVHGGPGRKALQERPQPRPTNLGDAIVPILRPSAAFYA